MPIDFRLYFCKGRSSQDGRLLTVPYADGFNTHVCVIEPSASQIRKFTQITTSMAVSKSIGRGSQMLVQRLAEEYSSVDADLRTLNHTGDD